ncbi:metal-dependent transcriptional regulator [Thermosipho ferrireducens]|uniref:Metal-dependent transcriptional regulator n=1 Tax=Thermosipho ferrireducens TaxID=2571116 RepID=A0ABX7S665_9BACT|nr:metal-dependent transcriptional regulator [Thermosipho ferrireducens]QTA37358.1 metal-dependent transcriptional regulator [Thermosipho ferrireducens]
MPEKKLTPTLENYLVAIYDFIKKNDVARVSEIANRKKVSYPSVTTAIKRLAELGYVEHRKYGFIKLTRKGYRLAATIKRAELRIKYFFIYIVGLAEQKAQKIAELMIYGLDPETRKALRRFYAIMIDFDESKVKKLMKFIEEQRKKAGLKNVPKEALDLKLRISEED